MLSRWGSGGVALVEFAMIVVSPCHPAIPVPQTVRRCRRTVTMKLTGHKSAEIHRGYTHLEMDTLKEAIKKLPGLT